MRTVIVNDDGLSIQDVVHTAIRSRVPGMDTDREVAGLIVAVSEMLPKLRAAAAGSCGGLK